MHKYSHESKRSLLKVNVDNVKNSDSIRTIMRFCICKINNSIVVALGRNQITSINNFLRARLSKTDFLHEHCAVIFNDDLMTHGKF